MADGLTGATPGADAIGAAVADAHRREWAFVLAATVRVTRDLDVAEECVQDAYATALATWPKRGVPDNPGGWLATVARHRALDLRRRAETARRRLPLLVGDQIEPGPADRDRQEIADDRLRLVFVCCHPALRADARVALTLRLVCGMTTADVAHAFLVREPTMAARITRAKRKIAAARIPFRVPPAEELPARVAAVLDVVHLLFSAGHTAPTGESLLRADLLDRSVDLARMLHRLLPGDAEATGLLALVLLTDARRATRTAPDGRPLLLAEQDRARWDRGLIDEGRSLVRAALRARPPGRFALLAAIAAVHADAAGWADTDWREIVALYDLLARAWPSPVVALNRAAAIGFADGPKAGLDALDRLADEPQLAGYHYLPAARADFLRRLGRTGDARTAYEEAIALAGNAAERQFLADRLRSLVD